MERKRGTENLKETDQSKKKSKLSLWKCKSKGS